MLLHHVESLSQLIAEKFKKRCANVVYSWKKYFNSDFTFSPYKFKKKVKDSSCDETSSSVKNNKRITAGKVRSELLCSMIQLHNALYNEESGDYKGQSQCYLFVDWFISYMFLFLCFRRVSTFGLFVPQFNSI